MTLLVISPFTTWSLKDEGKGGVKRVSMKLRKERLDRGIKARCEDIFAISSCREILYLAFPRVLPVAALLILPLLKDVV